MSLYPREHWFEMSHMFDDFFHPKAQEKAPVVFAPKVDIVDREDHYQVLAELPGVKREDINVKLHDGVLTIEAKSEQKFESGKDKVIRKEIRNGYFARSFNIGKGVAAEDIKANFENGVLTLDAPKIPEAVEQQRNIPIN